MHSAENEKSTSQSWTVWPLIALGILVSVLFCLNALQVERQALPLALTEPENRLLNTPSGSVTNFAHNASGYALPGNPRCTTVVIPSYIGHFGALARFMASLSKYMQGAEHTCIMIVVSNEDERREFATSLGHRFPSLRIEVRNIEELACEVWRHCTFSSRDYLSRSGKFNYQSYKKITGVLYAKNRARDFPESHNGEWFVVLDSEGVALRPFSFEQWTQEFARDRRIFYSKGLSMLRMGAGMPEKMGEILPAPGYFLEYYQWIFEGRVLDDFVEFFSTSGFSDWNWKGDLFVEVLYYRFLYNRNIQNNYGYTFVDIPKAFVEVNNLDDGLVHKVFKRAYRRGCFLEHFCKYFLRSSDPDISTWAKNFVDRYSLRVLRPFSHPAVFKFFETVSSVQIAVSDDCSGLFDAAMAGRFVGNDTHHP